MRFVKPQPKGRPPSWSPNTKSHKRRKGDGGPSRAEGTKKFVAIDGEGIDINGEHVYVLIRVGTNPPLENPSGLHWRAIFNYIYQYNEPGTAFVGFYLGYDFTQIFKTMREDRARKLLTREGIASRKMRTRRDSMPVECDEWQFDMLGKKRLRIRPKVCNCTVSLCKCAKPHWMYICDAGGFFQTTFLVAIDPAKWPDPILTDDEYATIGRGKEARATASLDDDMRAYNLLENDVMARLMPRVDDGLRHLGVTLSPKQWFSPAQAAQAWMQDRVPTRETIERVVPDYFRDAARAGYIAGWFELMMHGPIPGITYEYDINSAYPDVAYRLPCLLHGTYSQGQGKPDNPGPYCMIRADVTVPKRGPNDSKGSGYKRYIGSMMHRKANGRIMRPIFTSGWYWQHEVDAAIKAGCCRVLKVYEWAKYEPCKCPSPLAELAGLYEERLRQNKDSPLGRACRLVYNSVYGKLAQNVGNPKYMNFVYASLITAGCRIRILEAIASHPEGKAAVAQIATDAVYFISPHPGLTVSKKLGEWDCKEHHNMTLFKPGVYWHDEARQQIREGKLPQFKSRGVSARDMASKLADLDEQFKAWNGRKPPPMTHAIGPTQLWPNTMFEPSFSMVSALQALVRNKWDMAGSKMYDHVRQSSNPHEKRQDAYYDEKADVYRSEPITNQFSGKMLEASHPYDAKFGISNPEIEWSDEQEERHGITPDGLTEDVFINALMPERRMSPDASKE